MSRPAAPLVAALLLVAGAAAAAPAPYKAPRTPLGQPDLQGVWNTQFILPLEARPDTPGLTLPEKEAQALADRIADEIESMAVNVLDPEVPGMNRTSAIRGGLAIVRGERRTRQVVEPASGRIPFSPQIARLRDQIDQSLRHEVDPPVVADHPEQRPSWERCLALQGDPPITVLNDVNPRNIVQTKDHVVILTEYGNEARIIPFADQHQPAPWRGPLGDSIARWEGDTLVIETIRLPSVDRIRVLPFLYVPYSAKVIEKYTRVSARELLYQYTIIEPNVYTGPWLAEYSLYRTNKPMYEFACHEGNYSLPNIMRGQREAERRRSATAVAN